MKRRKFSTKVLTMFLLVSIMMMTIVPITSVATFGNDDDDLRITKSASKNSTFVGDTVTFTIKVENKTGIDLTNVVVDDTNPLGDKTIGPMLKNAIHTYTYDVVVFDNVHGDLAYKNTAEAYEYVNESKLYKDSDYAKVNLYRNLKITKVADKDSTFYGDTVMFTITVTNHTGEALTNASVDDTNDLGDKIIGEMAINQTYTYSYSAIVYDNVIHGEAYKNTATVTGINSSQAQYTDSDEECVGLFKKVFFTKVADKDSTFVGDTVNFTITIVNHIGENLDSVMVNDTNDLGDKNIGTILDGATYTYTYSVAVYGNVPMVNGYWNEAWLFSDDYWPIKANEFVTLYEAQPSISIDKTVSDSSPLINTEVLYTINYSNTGNVPLTNIEIDDTINDGDLTLPTLAAGTSGQIQYYYTPTTQGDFTNTVTMDASFNDEPLMQVTDSETIFVENPMFTFEKTPNIPKDEKHLPGDMVSYLFTFINTGNVPLENPYFTDVENDYTLFYQFHDGIMPIDSSWTTNLRFPVTEDGMNTAVAGANFEEEPLEVIEDTALVTLYEPEIYLEKSVEPYLANEGDTVTYEFYIENTGDYSFAQVMLTDDMLDLDPVEAGIQNTIYLGPLASGDEPISYSVDYVVPVGAFIDDDYIYNEALVEGMKLDPIMLVVLDENDGDDVGLPAPSYITVATDNSYAYLYEKDTPILIIDKEGNRTSMTSGQNITYTINVRNEGNVPFFDLHVYDPLIGVDEYYDELMPGESIDPIEKVVSLTTGDRNSGLYFINTAYADAYYYDLMLVGLDSMPLLTMIGNGDGDYEIDPELISVSDQFQVRINSVPREEPEEPQQPEEPEVPPVVEEEEVPLAPPVEEAQPPVIEEEEVPLDAPTIVEEEEVPLDAPMPKTNELPAYLFYGLGSGISALGVALKRNKK